MKSDGKPGNYAAAVAAWNAAHPNDQIKSSGGSSTADKIGKGVFGLSGLLLG
jgi:hypothetical protein